MKSINLQHIKEYSKFKLYGEIEHLKHPSKHENRTWISCLLRWR